MYLKYIYFMPSILQIHLHMYVLNKNTLQKYPYLIIYLMHFNYAEVVQLKTCCISDCMLKWNYYKYTPGAL